MSLTLEQQAHILIVDDQIANVVLLQQMLEDAGYTHLHVTTDPHEALSLYHAVTPDLLILDLMMPKLDGFAIMEHLGASGGIVAPTLVITADSTPEAKHRTLRYGVQDFITKPFDVVEVLLRVRNLLRSHGLQQQIEQHNRVLERQVRARTQQLEDAYVESLRRLAHAAEYRDDVTGQHTERVGDLAARIAEALGQPAHTVALLRLAAPLHDIGKIAIPDAILLKPGRLTVEEFQHMTAHTTIGGDILSHSQHPLLQLAEEIALVHHERWDGTGYPRGLHGESIPLAGRIVAVADVFDALTNERPYKAAWSREEAWTEIERGSGTHFDPAVVTALGQVLGLDS